VTPGQRIKAVRDERELSQAQLAKSAGITQPSLSDIERGETKGEGLKAKTLLGIARALGLTTRWILTGKGEKYADKALSEQEESLLGLFESLSGSNRSAVLATALALYRTQDDQDDDTPDRGPHHNH
jgi:transcriptional regulator with XRE-family HTH domain